MMAALTQLCKSRSAVFPAITESRVLIPEHLYGATYRSARKAWGHRLLRLFPTLGR
jgi:hypothetical protein